jgi:hypothetical protein
MKKILGINVIGTDYTGPEVGVVEIPEQIEARILQLAAAAKDLGVFGICECNSMIELYMRDQDAETEDGPIVYRSPDDEDEEDACRPESLMLNVGPAEFYWSGYIGFTDIRWETDAIPISDLSPKSSVPVGAEG